MAVKISTPKMDFLQKVLEPTLAETWGKTQALDNAGVMFYIELLSVKAVYDGHTYALQLKCSTTSMMSDPTSPAAGQARLQLANFMHSLYTKVLWTAIPGPAGPGKATDPYDGSISSLIAATSQAGGPGVVVGMDLGAKPSLSSVQSIATPYAPKIKPGVIKLRDAEALGQEVQGSSAGSVYRVVAASATVKVACRMANAGISLRIEGAGMSESDLAKIKQAGVPWHGDIASYGSLHLQDPGDIPLPAILGKFLYSLGVKFDRVIQPGEGIPS